MLIKLIENCNISIKLKRFNPKKSPNCPPNLPNKSFDVIAALSSIDV